MISIGVSDGEGVEGKATGSHPKQQALQKLKTINGHVETRELICIAMNAKKRADRFLELQVFW